jgi:3-oxoacyl-[acyl-carrier protein] reductase
VRHLRWRPAFRGGGLGQAVARALHAAGHTVVAADRSDAGPTPLPAGIHREIADATDPAVPKPLIDRIARQIGPPDILVNTIGAHELGDSLSVTPATLRRLMDINVGAALWLTQAVVPHMRDKGSGVIVHIGARPGLPQLILTTGNKAVLPPAVLAGAVEPEALADVIASLVDDRFSLVGGAVIPAYG